MNVKDVCNSTGNIVDTIARASGFGSDLSVVGTSDEGTSWITSILTSESQTAVK